MTSKSVARSFPSLALRDSFILAATVVLWLTSPQDHWLQYLTGGLTGLCFLLLHEWGHLYGAYRASAVVRPGPIWGPFLFDADSQANSRSQFLSLSLWGFAATGVMLCFFALWMPWDHTAGLISWYIAITLASLTVIIEFPIAWRVYRGKSIPSVEIYNRP